MRLTFSEGVSRPFASVKSVVRTLILRIDSARETCSFAEATAFSREASTSTFVAASATLIGGSECAASQSGSISASSVMSAATKGRWSPTTRTWEMSGWERIGFSRAAGATFLPPAVTMISFARPVMDT